MEKVNFYNVQVRYYGNNNVVRFLKDYLVKGRTLTEVEDRVVNYIGKDNEDYTIINVTESNYSDVLL